MPRLLQRRTFIRGAAGAAVGLPLLSAMEAAGQTGSFPKRFIVVYHPNGAIPNLWFPQSTGGPAEFSLGAQMQPLAPHKQDLIIFNGLHLDAPDTGPGEDHQQGMGGFLTGQRLQEGNFVGGNGATAGWANGPSVDHEMEGLLAGDVRFNSLHLGVHVNGEANPNTRLSFAGPAQPKPIQNDPSRVFEQLFSEFPEASQRLTILDAVRENFDRLRRRVGVEDRLRLDQHAEMVRNLERQITSTVPIGGVCQQPESPGGIDPFDTDRMHEVSALQTDLLAMAMACDQTRVATLTYCGASNGPVMTFLGNTDWGHLLSHSSYDDTSMAHQWRRSKLFTVQELARLISALKALPEGDGTVFDNTVILYGTEISEGNTHSHKSMPYLLAGSFGGAFRTGRYLRYGGGGRQQNELLLSLLQAAGSQRESFGLPAFCPGPLPDLV